MTIYPTLAARYAALADALQRRTAAWDMFLALSGEPAGAATAYAAYLAADAAWAVVRREEWRVPNEEAQ